ncbi:Putative ribonuclease H protein At1g65750 [Linum perenne]
MTPIGVGMEAWTVRDLMITGHSTWDEDCIRGNFERDDAEAILNIPLTSGDQPDERVWHYEKHGKYSVKSAYRLLMYTMVDRGALEADGAWRELWDTHAPPKMKHLVWRLGRGVVSTKFALQRRGVQLPMKCGICEEGLEDSWHLFVGCSLAKDCWRRAGLWNRVEVALEDCYDFRDWVSKLVRTVVSNEREKVMAILWSIWKEKNNRVWRQTRSIAKWVVQFGLTSLKEWQAARRRPNVETEHDAARCLRWHPPTHGELKCNTDYATFPNEHKSDFGVVVRDEAGDLIKFGMQARAVILTPTEGEGLAMLTSMLKMEEEGLERVVFETDVQQVVQALRRLGSDRSEFGDVVRKCKEVLARNPGFYVQFSRRVQNKVAHELAMQSFSFTTPHWDEISPNWLSEP